MEILIDNRQDIIELDDALLLMIEKAIKCSLEVENYTNNVEISISFVTDEEIKQLNKDYRNIDSITDVLSFPMEEEFIIPGENEILGDIIISTKRAIEQANEFEHSINRELIYLTVHSIFHLLGYDHIKDEDKIVMRKKEKETIKRLGIFRNEK